MNGDQLATTGHGIEDMDARELCDLSYALITGGIERQYYALLSGGAKFEDSTDPIGDQITEFEEKFGLREDPSAIALELHKRLLASRGIPWDDTPVGAGSGEWWDQDIEFTDMSDLDKKKQASEGIARTRRIFRKE